MSIARHGKNYWLDFYVGKHRVRRSLHTSEHALAIERARDIAVELRRPKPAGTDIAEFSTQYLTWARQTKPASVRGEEYRVKIMLDFFARIGVTMLENITPYHVEQFRASVMTRAVGHTDKTVGKSAANRYLALLRTLINRAIDWNVFPGPNPVSKVRFYKEGAKIRPLTEDELGRVLEAARAIGRAKYAGPMARALYDVCCLILQTGLRRSEALNLRWMDIGDDELTIRGKGGKVRTVPLNAEARAITERQVRAGPFIFAVPNRGSGGVLRRVTETVTRRAGVRFHLHLLRHKFCSRLIGQGTDIVTVGELMGHSSAMTSLLYSHSNSELKKRAIDNLIKS
jgi:integrase